MEIKKPIFVDPRLRRIYERQIYRPMMQPDLWNGQKMQRLFLLYGQKGSGMEDAILQLLKEHPPSSFSAIRVTKDAAEMKEVFGALKKETKFIPLLIIRKAHLLKYHREIFLITHDLKLLQNVGFIIAISEDVPDEEHPFWEQFQPGARIPNGLPNKDFYKQLIDWYVQDWEKSGSPAAVQKGSPGGSLFAPLDTSELAICCAYTTQSDVKRFIRRIIGHIIDLYPEERPLITMDTLRDLGFLYPFAGSTSVLSISPNDGHMIQMRYDPKGITEAPTANEAATAEGELKKMKFTVE
jgi:hypothetical protein